VSRKFDTAASPSVNATPNPQLFAAG